MKPRCNYIGVAMLSGKEDDDRMSVDSDGFKDDSMQRPSDDGVDLIFHKAEEIIKNFIIGGKGGAKDIANKCKATPLGMSYEYINDVLEIEKLDKNAMGRLKTLLDEIYQVRLHSVKSDKFHGEDALASKSPIVVKIRKLMRNDSDDEDTMSVETDDSDEERPYSSAVIALSLYIKEGFGEISDCWDALEGVELRLSYQIINDEIKMEKLSENGLKRLDEVLSGLYKVRAKWIGEEVADSEFKEVKKLGLDILRGYDEEESLYESEDEWVRVMPNNGAFNGVENGVIYSNSTSADNKEGRGVQRLNRIFSLSAEGFNAPAAPDYSGSRAAKGPVLRGNYFADKEIIVESPSPPIKEKISDGNSLSNAEKAAITEDITSGTITSDFTSRVPPPPPSPKRVASNGAIPIVSPVVHNNTGDGANGAVGRKDDLIHKEGGNNMAKEVKRKPSEEALLKAMKKSKTRVQGIGTKGKGSISPKHNQDVVWEDPTSVDYDFDGQLQGDKAKSSYERSEIRPAQMPTYSQPKPSYYEPNSQEFDHEALEDQYRRQSDIYEKSERRLEKLEQQPEKEKSKGFKDLPWQTHAMVLLLALIFLGPLVTMLLGVAIFNESEHKEGNHDLERERRKLDGMWDKLMELDEKIAHSKSAFVRRNQPSVHQYQAALEAQMKENADLRVELKQREEAAKARQPSKVNTRRSHVDKVNSRIHSAREIGYN